MKRFPLNRTPVVHTLGTRHALARPSQDPPQVTAEVHILIHASHSGGAPLFPGSTACHAGGGFQGAPIAFPFHLDGKRRTPPTLCLTRADCPSQLSIFRSWSRSTAACAGRNILFMVSMSKVRGRHILVILCKGTREGSVI